MSIHISAEAACNHCGKTTPCKLYCCIGGEAGVGSYSFQKVAVAAPDLQGWFSWNYLVACSVACKDALSAFALVVGVFAAASSNKSSGVEY